MRAFNADMGLIWTDGIGSLLCGSEKERISDDLHYVILNFGVRVTLRVTV